MQNIQALLGKQGCREVRFMNYFYVVNGKKIKQVFIIAVAIIFAIGIIYSERDQVTVFSQSEPAAIYSVQTEKKWIALTFDISWGTNEPNQSSKFWRTKE